MAQIILASGSVYKATLFARLRLPFNAVNVDMDETPLPGEMATDLAPRLAEKKALALTTKHPDAILIGADQVASSSAFPLIGKPGSLAANRSQLLALSEQEVLFYTAICVVSPAENSAQRQIGHHLDVTRVRFRSLTEMEVDNYLALEPSPDCAGGCKVEGLGITLLESVNNSDPTALVGLPLIALSKLLRAAGIMLPFHQPL